MNLTVEKSKLMGINRAKPASLARITAYFLLFVFIIAAGCQEEATSSKSVHSPSSTQIDKTGPAPKISFDEVVHDFGRVPPGSKTFIDSGSRTPAALRFVSRGWTSAVAFELQPVKRFVSPARVVW